MSKPENYMEIKEKKKKETTKICYVKIALRRYTPFKMNKPCLDIAFFHDTQRHYLRQANIVTQNVKVWKCCSQNFQIHHSTLGCLEPASWGRRAERCIQKEETELVTLDIMALQQWEWAPFIHRVNGWNMFKSTQLFTSHW